MRVFLKNRVICNCAFTGSIPPNPGKMNAYKEDPQLALTTLQKIAEEIPSGVSPSDVRDMVARVVANQEELTATINEDVAQELKNCLAAFWEEQNVGEKLSDVANLKRSKSPKPFPLPLSPRSQLNSVKAKHLRLRKRELEAKIQQVKAENSEMQSHLATQAQVINRQMNDIKSCDLLL